MDKKIIDTLRNKISIPLHQAIMLLKHNNGDIDACEKHFHADQVAEICQVTECDEETAEEYYKRYNQDKETAIEKVFNRTIIVKTRNGKSTNIGYSLYPEKSNGQEYTNKKKSEIFIPTDDFDYIIDTFQSVYPHKCPYSGEIEKAIYPCGYNAFENEKAQIILGEIKKINTTDPIVEDFLNAVKKWFENTLQYADIIVVEGNL